MIKTKKVATVVNNASNSAAYISMIAVAIMALLNVADIFASKVGGSSIQGAYEISECVLMCGVFSSLAYAQTQKTHVHMTLFIEKLPGKLKYVPFFVCSLLSTAVAIVLAFAIVTKTMSEYENHTVTGILGIVYWPFYVVSIIGIVVFCITLLYDLYISFMAMFKKEYGDIVSSNW